MNQQVLDIKFGVQIVCNDELVYKSLLKKLLNKNIYILSDLYEFLTQSSYEQALKILHVNKAAFAMLGANEVYNDILTLENVIRKFPFAIIENYTNMQDSINRLKIAITEYLNI